MDKIQSMHDLSWLMYQDRPYSVGVGMAALPLSQLRHKDHILTDLVLIYNNRFPLGGLLEWLVKKAYKAPIQFFSQNDFLRPDDEFCYLSDLDPE